MSYNEIPANVNPKDPGRDPQQPEKGVRGEKPGAARSASRAVMRTRTKDEDD